MAELPNAVADGILPDGDGPGPRASGHDFDALECTVTDLEDMATTCESVLPGAAPGAAKHSRTDRTTECDEPSAIGRRTESSADRYVAAAQRGRHVHGGPATVAVRSKAFEDSRAPPDIKIDESNEAAWEWFREIDVDGSGFLDETELRMMLGRLGVRGLSARRALKELRSVPTEVGEDSSKGTSFRSFALWWNRRMEIDRRRARREVKELFEAVDVDNSGLLDKHEVATFFKMAHKHIKVNPPFSLDDDWVRLCADSVPIAAGEKQGVTFPMFESWWKDRAGIRQADLAVIPEFIVERLQEEQGGLVMDFEGRRRRASVLQTLQGDWHKKALWVGRIEPESANETALRGIFTQCGPVHSIQTRVKDGDCKSWALVSFCNESDVNRVVAGQWVLPPGLKWKVEQIRPDRMQSLQALFVQASMQVGHSSRGKALWFYLRSRLRELINIEKVWGSVHSMYESRDVSLYQSMPLPMCIRDPDGSSAAFWDTSQVVLLFWVAITLPLVMMFEVEIYPGHPVFYINLCADVLFAIDVVLNFRTAYKHPVTGVVEERPRKIAKNYFFGWFILDFVSCLPLQYVEFEGGKGLKSLRLLRLSKMLRVAKFRKYLAKFIQGRYGLVSEMMTFTAIFLAIVYCAHLLSCFWYAVGREVEEMVHVGADGPKLTVGWVHREYCCDDSQTDPSGSVSSVRIGCTDAQFEALKTTSLSERYVTSLYYVFNALEAGETAAERGFAVLAELAVGLIFGALAGLFSSVMMTLRGNTAEVGAKLQGLQVWLQQKNVPKTDEIRIMDYFHQLWHSENKVDPATILQDMPPTMGSDVLSHLYSRFLGTIPLFRGLSDEVLNALCRKVQPITTVAGQEIIREGDTGSEMYMVMKGEVEVLQDGARLGFLAEGAFFGEIPVLLEGSGTETRVRTVRAVSACELCFLTRTAAKELRAVYAELDARLRRLAAAGRQLTRRRLNALKLTAMSMKEHVNLYNLAKVENTQTTPNPEHKKGVLKSVFDDTSRPFAKHLAKEFSRTGVKAAESDSGTHQGKLQKQKNRARRSSVDGSLGMPFAVPTNWSVETLPRIVRFESDDELSKSEASGAASDVGVPPDSALLKLDAKLSLLQTDVAGFREQLREVALLKDLIQSHFAQGQQEASPK